MYDVEDLGWDVVAEGESKYVDVGENGVMRSGEIWADNLNTCIGIGIYDEATGEGYLSHIDTIAREDEDVIAQVQEFLINLPDLEEPQAVLTGGAYPDPEDEVDTDLGDNALKETYRIGGLKTSIKRILEQEVTTHVDYQLSTKDNTSLNIDPDGIETKKYPNR